MLGSCRIQATTTTHGRPRTTLEGPAIHTISTRAGDRSTARAKLSTLEARIVHSHTM